MEQLHWNIHTNGAHKNNNNNITPIFMGLNKTTQKTQTQEEKLKSGVLKQMYFNVNDGDAITLEYFNLRTNAV
jgi:hypothetical protein